jgi:hypothetical protein
MKKKILATAMVAVVAAIAVCNVYQAKSDVQLSDLQMANVEALANNENDYDKKIWERYYRPDNTGYNCVKLGGETC